MPPNHLSLPSKSWFKIIFAYRMSSSVIALIRCKPYVTEGRMQNSTLNPVTSRIPFRRSFRQVMHEGSESRYRERHRVRISQLSQSKIGLLSRFHELTMFEDDRLNK